VSKLPSMPVQTHAPHERDITLSDGSRIAFADWGGSGAPCIFVHGIGHHGRVWDPSARAVAATGLQSIAIDLPGHGRSSWGPPYSVVPLGRRVAEALDRLSDGRPPVLVGHSLGGDICLRYIDDARPIAGLVLVDSGPEPNRDGVEHVRRTEAEAASEFADRSEALEYFRNVHPLAGDEAIEQLVRHGTEPTAHGGLVRLKDPAFGWPYGSGPVRGDHWALLARITVPTLVVRGVASSILTKEVAQRMVGSLADGRLVTVPLSGHAVMLDNPTGLAAVIEDFAGRLIAPSGPQSGT
jgi:pimeloyl-ACP methyl ester carboxylesterase